MHKLVPFGSQLGSYLVPIVPMGSLDLFPTNLKWFPDCSPVHTLFQDRFKDVQVVSRWFSALYILSPNFHTKRSSHDASRSKLGIVWPSIFQCNWGGPLLGVQGDSAVTFFCQNWRSFDKQQYFCKAPQCPTATPSIMAWAATLQGKVRKTSHFDSHICQCTRRCLRMPLRMRENPCEGPLRMPKTTTKWLRMYFPRLRNTK